MQPFFLHFSSSWRWLVSFMPLLHAYVHALDQECDLLNPYRIRVVLLKMFITTLFWWWWSPFIWLVKSPWNLEATQNNAMKWWCRENITSSFTILILWWIVSVAWVVFDILYVYFGNWLICHVKVIHYQWVDRFIFIIYFYISVYI